MKSFLYTLVISITLFSCKTAQQHTQKQEKANVIFISIDDLRPDLGCYGNTVMQTPNIDKLAANSVQFNNAYCQVPVCGASRSSLHTGIRPTRTRFVDYNANIDEDTPNAVTIGQHFKQNGYYTLSYGKIIHGYQDAAERTWSEYHPAENMFEYQNPENKAYEALPKAKRKKYKHAAAYEKSVNTKDTDFLDGRTLDRVSKRLEKLKTEKKPFFLAVGFARPHLPFVAPKRFWDLYSEKDIQDAPNHFLPKDVPKVALSSWGELRAYRGIPKKGNITDKQTRLNLKHGYYASVSFSDYLVGKLIKKLKELDLYDNSIIVLLGDHGYQLGEHTMWAKHTNFDIALKTPLIIKAPHHKKALTTNALAELVDVFPTLSDLANLPILKENQGSSLKPIVENKASQIHNYVVSRWKSGDSVKDERYRYTEFTSKEGKIIAKMLFDHQNDPNENVNIADKPENKVIVDRMSAYLKETKKKYNL